MTSLDTDNNLKYIICFNCKHKNNCTEGIVLFECEENYKGCKKYCFQGRCNQGMQDHLCNGIEYYEPAIG